MVCWSFVVCIMVKNQTYFMIWFLHGGLQSCYFVSNELPKSSNLGHIQFLHGGWSTSNKVLPFGTSGSGSYASHVETRALKQKVMLTKSESQQLKRTDNLTYQYQFPHGMQTIVIGCVTVNRLVDITCLLRNACLQSFQNIALQLSLTTATKHICLTALYHNNPSETLPGKVINTHHQLSQLKISISMPIR